MVDKQKAEAVNFGVVRQREQRGGKFVLTGEYHMSDSKATSDAIGKTRFFDVVFVCEDCEVPEEVTVEIENLPSSLSTGEVTLSLQIFSPFCCIECGSDAFGIDTWTEIK